MSKIEEDVTIEELKQFLERMVTLHLDAIKAQLHTLSATMDRIDAELHEFLSRHRAA